jgi:ornithine cyclodeaminase/alanine dehydrogenase-like protein (mu-crystallin family)
MWYTLLTVSPSFKVMDGNVITAKRTAAVSAIATKVRLVTGCAEGKLVVGAGYEMERHQSLS